MSFSNGNLEKVQLNNEELQKLLNKMSSDERKELTDTLRSCTSEVTMTRGLPITAAVLGSLYFARTRLPAQYHFGPKGWPFYAIMGIGTLTTVNVFSMGSCRERVQPLIARMWQKYNIGHSSTSYEEIRRRHRQEQGFRTPDAGHAAHARSRVPEFSALTDQTYGNMTDSYGISTDTMPANDGSMSRDYTKPRGERTFDLSQDGSPGAADSRRTPMPPQGYMYGSEAPSYMSGTPVTPRGAQSPSSDEYFR